MSSIHQPRRPEPKRPNLDRPVPDTMAVREQLTPLQTFDMEVRHTQEPRTMPTKHTDERAVPILSQRPETNETWFNSLYDSQSTQAAWHRTADVAASLSVTLTSAATQTTPYVLLSTPFSLSVGEWPGGIQAFLVLRLFSAGVVGGASNDGTVSFVHYAADGTPTPLGVLACNATASNLSMTSAVLLPTSLTDPTITAGSLGSLQTVTTTLATSVALSAQVAFSVAYLLNAQVPNKHRQAKPMHGLARERE